MKMQRSIRTSLAGALALALSGVAAAAAAQAPPPQTTRPPTTTPPAPPVAMPIASQQQVPAPAEASSTRFAQGTVSTATYPIQNGTLTVRAGMSAQSPDYGAPPSFETLDTNGDGQISETEAQAYLLLRNDFLHASHNGQTISRAAYQKWVRGLGTQ